MAYYHIDKSARRIKEELGYGNYVNNTGLKGFVVDPRGKKNHFVYDAILWRYTYIAFSDTAIVNGYEDGDIIWHEHAHAIQYHFGKGLRGSSGECGAIKEGCASYWAISNKLNISDYQWQYLGIWRYNSIYWWPAINYNLKYPQNYSTSYTVHENGRIFTSALMKIQDNIADITDAATGRDIADKLFLEMHYRWSNPTNFYNAANAYLESAKFFDNGIYYCIVASTLDEFGLLPSNVKTYSVQGPIQYAYIPKIISSDIKIQNAIINNGLEVKVTSCNEIIGAGLRINSGAIVELEADGVIDVNNIVILSGGILKLKTTNDIIMREVTVNSGGTLELDAGGKISVEYGNFRIMEGAGFVVK